MTNRQHSLGLTTDLKPSTSLRNSCYLFDFCVSCVLCSAILSPTRGYFHIIHSMIEQITEWCLRREYLYSEARENPQGTEGPANQIRIAPGGVRGGQRKLTESISRVNLLCWKTIFQENCNSNSDVVNKGNRSK